MSEHFVEVSASGKPPQLACPRLEVRPQRNDRGQIDGFGQTPEILDGTVRRRVGFVVYLADRSGLRGRPPVASVKV
jgi:hypothetical protein